MDWSDGYVADINYNSHYYAELNPIRMQLALLNAGYKPPKIENACELGFGQGISVNVHAAGESETRWYGNDFLPQQAQAAQKMAEVVGSKAVLTDESFAEFCTRPDLPDFDYICLHGIWSWISDENRSIIIDFIRRKLRVGGVVYISYNVLPGWSSAAPMRELFNIHARQFQAPAVNSLDKVDAALDYVGKLFDTQPGYVQNRPDLIERFKQLGTMNKNYLAHEYFNRDWKPMYFHQIADLLSETKLSFATTAAYNELLDEVWLTPEQRAFMDEAPNHILAQQLRDFMVNQQFRRDIWIKGGEQLTPEQSLELIREQRVVLATLPDEVKYEVSLGGRTVTLQEEIYRPLISVLSDHKPHDIGSLIDGFSGAEVQPLQVLQAIMVLIGVNHVIPGQSAKAAKAAEATIRRFNTAALQNSAHTDESSIIASSFSSSGLPVDPVTLRMLRYLKLDRMKPADVVTRISEELATAGRVMRVDGEPAKDQAANLGEIRRVVERLTDRVIPVFEGNGYLF